MSLSGHIKKEDIMKLLINEAEEYPSEKCVEQIIVKLLIADDLAGAVSLAKKIKPSTSFASAFARELLNSGADIESFLSLKIVAEERVTEEEADIIIMRYIGPNGKNKSYARSIPKEILEVASKKVMVMFFQSIMEDRSAGNMDYARIFWPYLKDKI